MIVKHKYNHILEKLRLELLKLCEKECIYLKFHIDIDTFNSTYNIVNGHYCGLYVWNKNMLDDPLFKLTNNLPRIELIKNYSV